MVTPIFFLTFLFTGLAQANSNPQSFTLQGQLWDDTTGALMTGSVDLTISILNPSGVCLLYEELQSGIDVTTTQGFFSVQVGSGTRVGGDAGFSMAKVFANAGVQVRAPDPYCPAGYTPAAGEGRKLRIKVKQLPSGATVQLSPDQEISSAPYAIVAETLQGKTPTEFIQNTGGNATQAGFAALTGGGDIGSFYHKHDSLYLSPNSVGSMTQSVVLRSVTPAKAGVQGRQNQPLAPGYPLSRV